MMTELALVSDIRGLASVRIAESFLQILVEAKPRFYSPGFFQNVDTTVVVVFVVVISDV